MSDVTIGVIARPELAPEDLVEAARVVEAAGVEELWLWEDCFWAGGLVASTAVLAATSRLRVGLGLMPVPLRNPALAAMEVAALARMFPGRFVPGLGHGVLDWMAQVGARAESPMALLRETTTAVRALLHGGSVSADGRYVQLDGVRLDHPPAPGAVPPVLLGARGPRTLKLTGEVSDGVILDSTPAVVREAVATLREGRAGSPLAGEPLHVVVFAEPADDPAQQAADYAAAGATSVVLQPPPEAPGPATVLEAARTAMGS